MQERLQWIRLRPRSWVDWAPLAGGMQAHAAVAGAYPDAQCWVVEANERCQHAVLHALRPPWWRRAQRRAVAAQSGVPPPSGVDMLWANMALHAAADPHGLLEQWSRMLAPDGFLMFSCLGPDTLVELRSLYRAQGWPPPAHEFTDMHDWGDMLLRAGFAEPVMDMERITLTFAGEERLLAELRGLGRNLHRERFAALRGRRWHAQLLAQLGARRTGSQPLALTFEVIYGHALKPQPRVPVQPEAVLSLAGMREALQRARRGPTAGS